jgi:SAM-dependent methyltransferase
MRRRLRRLRLTALDLRDLVLRRRPPMTPSRVQNESIGGFDFHRIGQELADLTREVGGLQPHERILDIGCGYGRLAVPLTRFLTGEYAGFDLNAAAIDWCRKSISRRHANFWFAHADVANSHYNPRGAVAAEEFRFPCADASVDLAVATSLFTHLLPAAGARYTNEIARVLKPGGRALLSFFLLDPELRARLADPRVRPPFHHFPEDYYAVTDPTDPELGVAYDLRVVQEAFFGAGLPIIRIDRGAWALHPQPLSFQDFVLAVKPAIPAHPATGATA